MSVKCLFFLFANKRSAKINGLGALDLINLNEVRRH